MGNTTIKKIDRIESNATGNIVVAPSSGKFEVESTYIEATNIKQNNLTAVVDPGINDDSGSNYSIGSQWTNTLSGARFQATDVTGGAAVWISIGGAGGGGGVDSYLNENFESKDSNDFTTGNNSTFLNGGAFIGALSEESGSPIEGDQSIKYVQGATSIDDWIAFENTAVGLQQRGKTNTYIMFAQYDGDDDDIEIIVWDSTNSIALSTGQFIKGTGTGPAKRYEIKFQMPLTTSIVNVGLQTKVTNDTKVCIFDLFELNTDPFAFTSITDKQYIFYTNSAGTSSSNTAIVYYNTFVKDEGSSIVSVSNSPTDGFSITALRDCVVTMSHNFASSGTVAMGISLNSSQLSTTILNITEADRITSTASNNTIAGNAAVRIALAKDDILRPHGEPNPALGTANRTNMTVVAEAQNEAIISNLTEGANWTAFTPEFVGLGTVTNARGFWKQVGDSMEIECSAISGTPTAVPIELSIPNSNLIELSKIDASGVRNQLGTANRLNGTTAINTQDNQSIMFSDATDNTVLFVCRNSASDSALDKTNGSGFIGNNETILIRATVPIAGFSIENSSTILSPLIQVAYIKDVKSSGTNGGTFTSGSYQTRALNTVEGDTSIVTIDSDQFTIVPGKFLIEAIAPGYAVQNHKCKIYDITNDVDLKIGKTSHSNSGAPEVTDSNVMAQVEKQEPTTYEIRHRCTLTGTNTGFGVASTYGDDEVYTQVKITKIK